MPMNTFVVTLKNMVRKWSRKYDPNNVNIQKFSDKVTISLSDWTKAYQWKQTKAIIQFGDYFYVQAHSNTIEITSQIIQKYESLMSNCEFDNFKKFVHSAYGIWRITVCTLDLFEDMIQNSDSNDLIEPTMATSIIDDPV